MVDEPTRIDRFVRRVKNNPVLATVLTVCIGVLALAGLVDAIDKIVVTCRSCYEHFHPPPRVPSVAEMQRTRAVAVIANYIQEPVALVEVKSLQWVDLAGKGDEQEFYVCYELGALRHVSVYTTRTSEPQRLFHEQSYSMDVGSAVYEGRQHVVVWHVEGSGGYLRFSVLGWDGVGSLQTKFADDAIFQGSLLFVDRQVYVSGAGQKHQLVCENGNFALRPYRLHPKYPEQGEGCHVLRIEVKEDRLVFEFDNEEVALEKAEDDRYVLKQGLPIRPGESVLIDDNLEQRRGLRLFGGADEVDWESGLYPMFVPIRRGSVKICINDSYGPWYEIWFDVKDRSDNWVTTLP